MRSSRPRRSFLGRLSTLAGIPLLVACDKGVVAESAPVTKAPPAPMTPAAAAQTTTIAAGDLKLEVHLPDAQVGYYRGTRFDWSTVLAQFSYKQHTFFAPFRRQHDPAGHDSITGTAEEFGFDEALGFQEAKPGETFLKIGVGELERPDDKEYGFFKPYKIVRPGTWTVTRTDHTLTFTQKVDGPRGWGYELTRTYSLANDPPRLIVQRTLKNTGSKPIATDHYTHNFLTIDGEESINDAYVLEFPFALQPERLRDQAGAVKIEGSTFRITRPIKGSIWGLLHGHKAAADNRVSVRNRYTGAELIIQGDVAPKRVAIYAQDRSICPEFFIPIDVNPGQEVTWTTTYTVVLHPAQPRKSHAVPAEERGSTPAATPALK